MNFDWRALVIQIAPSLGSVLQGPLSGVAIAFLVDKLIGTAEDPDAALSEVIGAQTPEIIAKIIALDVEFKGSLSSLNIDNALLKDVAQAREREMTLRDHTPAVLAASVTIGLFSIIYLLIFVAIPQDSINIVNIMLGSLSTAWMNVIAYYFGSVKTPTVVPMRAKK